MRTSFVHGINATNLETALQEFIFDLEEIAFALLSAEWLIDNRKARIVLYILISSITIPEINTPSFSDHPVD